MHLAGGTLERELRRAIADCQDRRRGRRGRRRTRCRLHGGTERGQAAGNRPSGEGRQHAIDASTPRFSTGAGRAPRYAVGVVRLRFWGVRGSVPWTIPAAIGHGCNTPCIEITDEESGDTLVI